MAQQENLPQIPQSLPKMLVKKKLKRWSPEKSDNGTYFLMKTKHKKTEKRIKANSNDNLQFLFNDIAKQFQERNYFILWVHTAQCQILERPISLYGQWSPLCPFKIYLKCLPDSCTPQTISRTHANFLTEIMQGAVDSFNVTQTNDISLFLELQFNSNSLEDNVIGQDSDMMLQLKSSLLSATDFVMTLYSKIHEIKTFDISTDNMIPCCITKVFTLKNSDEKSKEANYFPNNHNSSKKLSIVKFDEIVNLRNHKETESSTITDFHTNLFLAASDHLKDAIYKEDSFMQNILSSSKTKHTDFPCQSKKDAPKKFKEHLMTNDVTFPLVKFNLDLEEISGSSEMFLSTSISHKCDNSSNDAELTFGAHNPCISDNNTMKNKCGSKELQISDITKLNIIEKDSKESQDANVNCKNTQSSSQLCTKSNFSETPILCMQDYKDALLQEYGNQNVLDVLVHDSENEEIEHVVPDINTIANQSMAETYLYEQCISSKAGLTSSTYQKNEKSSQNTSELQEKSITAFHWRDRSFNVTDVSVSDQCSYPPVQQCNRPLRIGLSKKQRVKHLHKK